MCCFIFHFRNSRQLFFLPEPSLSRPTQAQAALKAADLAQKMVRKLNPEEQLAARRTELKRKFRRATHAAIASGKLRALVKQRQANLKAAEQSMSTSAAGAGGGTRVSMAAALAVSKLKRSTRRARGRRNRANSPHFAFLDGGGDRAAAAAGGAGGGAHGGGATSAVTHMRPHKPILEVTVVPDGATRVLLVKESRRHPTQGVAVLKDKRHTGYGGVVRGRAAGGGGGGASPGRAGGRRSVKYAHEAGPDVGAAGGKNATAKGGGTSAAAAEEADQHKVEQEVGLRLPAIGFSLVDNVGLARPREVAYLWMEWVSASVVARRGSREVDLRVQSLQLDNQMPASAFKVSVASHRDMPAYVVRYPRRTPPRFLTGLH